MPVCLFIYLFVGILLFECDFKAPGSKKAAFRYISIYKCWGEKKAKNKEARIFGTLQTDFKFYSIYSLLLVQVVVQILVQL